MRNLLKKTKHTLFSAAFLLLLFVPGMIGHSAPQWLQKDVTCPEPDVRLTSKTGTTVTFVWDAVSGAEIYKIRCVCKDNNTITNYTTTNLTIPITLPSGTYSFSFCTTCSSGDSDYVIIDDIYL